MTALGYQFNDFGAIVAASALSHDIGNPPFGHSGEKAIGDFFRNGAGSRYKEALHPAEFQDLLDFEGNAFGFKLLTSPKDGNPGGLRLSYATLGSFIKYPKESLPKKPTNEISDKKFGLFQSELPFFSRWPITWAHQQEPKTHCLSATSVGIPYEAADDICYTIIDFEDGINLGLISMDYALEHLINLVKDKLDIKKYHQISSNAEKLSYLRAIAIGTLINDSGYIFGS